MLQSRRKNVDVTPSRFVKKTTILCLENNRTVTFPFAGGEDDDGSSHNICRVLATISTLLYSYFIFPLHRQHYIRPRNILGHLLVSNEQFYV